MKLDRSRIVWKLCLYGLVGFLLLVTLYPRDLILQAIAFAVLLVLLGWGVYLNAFVYRDARLTWFANLFQGELACAVCGSLTPKRELAVFHSFGEASLAKANKLTVCRACLLDLFHQSLTRYQFRSVVVYPTKFGTAYQFYSVTDLRTYHFDAQLIADLLKFLPPADARCAGCGGPAQFHWCAPDIFYNDPIPVGINFEEEYPREYLCSKCLAERFREIVQREDLYFIEILPPKNADGVCMTWDM